MGYLGTELGAEVYADGCSYVDEKDSNYVLTERKEIVIPDMDIRTTDASYITRNETDDAMGYVGRSENIFCISASAHQTMTYYVPLETWTQTNITTHKGYRDHPKFYNKYSTGWYEKDFASLSAAEKPTQVCFNANGDAEELQLLKQAFLEKMIWGLKRFPSSYIFVFGVEDNIDRCDCKTCSDMKEEYGVDNASGVIFANAMADLLEAWMDTEEGRPYKKDFLILVDAYELDIKAPATYNEETEEWEPIDDTVVCNDHVAVFFAPAHMDFRRSIYDEANRTTYEAYEGWKVCSPRGVCLYLYQSNWQDPIAFFDAYSCMQELYRYFNTANVLFIHHSGFSGNPMAPGFEGVTHYIQSLLVKDVNVDVRAATERYFANYYGAASEAMLDYFDSYLAWTKHLRDDKIYKTDGIDNDGDGKTDSVRYIYEVLVREFDYWDSNWAQDKKLENFDTWMACVEKALLAIEPLKTTDEETYNILYDRIILERIPIAYLAQEFGDRAQMTNYSHAELRQMVKDDCARLGIDNRGRLGTMTELFERWEQVS